MTRSSIARMVAPVLILLALAAGGLHRGAAQEKRPPQKIVRIPLADGFDFPVGWPNAEGYYLYRGFWPNGHLGDDWNGVGGGNSDLGDPIYSIGTGVVTLAGDMKKGWGKTVIVRHAFRDRATGRVTLVDSFYTHLLDFRVKVGDLLKRGQRIGSLGSNNGMYAAHLHLEIRKNINIGMDRSRFARDYSNYYSPKHFIEANRQLPRERATASVPLHTYGL
jgi:murein DD-endopeptidase MepM/ murein hydrolase activator NlpD